MTSGAQRTARVRVLVAIGTRPEVIKLAPVVHELARRDWCELRVVATGQHEELAPPLLELFGIAVDRRLEGTAAAASLAGSTSRMLDALDPVLADERPDLVLAQGDTTTVLATALACFYRGIAFGHVEAGLRTRQAQSPFPEEKNRELVARLASLHFAPTPAARANLVAEGIPAERVLVTGNTVVDALLAVRRRIDASRFARSDGRALVLVTAHRRESFGAPLASICAALRELAASESVHVLYPVHPNPSVDVPVRRLLGGAANIELVAPLDYESLLAALAAATVVLTDSGGIQEEAPSFGKPVVVLRAHTERVEAVAAGSAFLAGTDPEAIVAQTRRLLHDAELRARIAKLENPFGDGHAARRIADAVAQLVGAEAGA